MISLSTYNVSAINTFGVEYTDPLLKYNQYRAGYEQGFALNKVNALTNTIDSSINNYTATYLTDKILFTDVFTLKEKPIEVKTITTPLIFNTDGGANVSRDRYLYIYRNFTETPAVVTCRVLLSSFIGYENNINFELEVLSNIFLRVKHNNGERDYFLNALDDSSLMFYSYSSETLPLTSERNDMFRYYLDDKGYLQLFKKTREGIKIVTLEEDKIVLKSIPTSGNTSSLNNTIKINYNFIDIVPILNNSWVSYDVDKPNTLSINTNKSQFDRYTQYVLHVNYNEVGKNINLNYLPLNNFRSEKNYIKRGANLEQGIPLSPDANFREYMSLQTGNSQEYGNDNIALTYVWYDKDIRVAPGSDTYFITPSSLYPFERININDSKFVANGAFAGKTPLLADKVFLLKDGTRNSGNGRYLCTWLSGGGSDRPGIWLDRYYYPDFATKQDALSGYPVYAPSFYDSIDSISYNDKVTLAKKSYFDKQSDLCLLPNTRYYYSRIGVEDINTQVYSSVPSASGFTDFYNVADTRMPYNNQEIAYDGTKYNKFNISAVQGDTNSLTISFDAYIDPSESYGYQLLGNLTNKGFGIINDAAVTPFIYTADKTELRIFNSSGDLLNIVSFDQNIIDVISSDAVGDFYVICESGYVYKVNTLGIKQKLEILPEIINYTSFYQDNDDIIFYVRGSSPTAYIVNKSTFESTTAVPVPFISNFSIIGDESLVKYNNQYLTLPGQKVKYIDSDNIYYSINDETIVRQNLRNGGYTQFLASSSKDIIDFTITPKNNLAVLHNKTKIIVFDENRNVLDSADYSSIIGLSSTFHSIDIVREYTDTGISESYVMSFIDESSKLKLFYGSSSTIVDTGLTARAANSSYNTRYVNRNKSQLTNFNHFKQINTTGGLDFKITLTNYLSSEDIVSKSIKINKGEIDRGYHTFTYRFDSLKGKIELFVNGNVYGSENVQPAKYSIQDIFNDNIYIGSTGFYNSQDLATYLRQPGYYFIRGLKVRNLVIYNRAITDDEVYALNLYGESINDLVLSVPAGQRNNIEEIERYFKFAPVGTSSKKVNIYVKNSGITDETLQNNIKNIILADAQATLPVGATINDIQFIDFK